MQELFSIRVARRTVRVADVHVALAVAVVLGLLTVAAL